MAIIPKAKILKRKMMELKKGCSIY